MSLDQRTVEAKLQADHRRAESLLELVPLLVHVVFGPNEELASLALTCEGQEKDHLAPGISRVLHHDRPRVAFANFDLLPLADPNEASFRHFRQLTTQPVSQAERQEQRREILRCENLLLFDDHAVGRGIPGSKRDSSPGCAQLSEFVFRALVGTLPGQLAAAIEGVGETGSRADADLVAPFLSANSPRIRRSALRALAKLDAERAVAAAMAALSDDAPSVRTAAVHTLSSNASRVNFDLVNRQVSSLSDPKARRSVLRVFVDAPKWDAPAFLLGALADPDDGVRAFAARLVDRWIESFNRNQTQPTAKQLQRIGALLDSVASRMPEETARMLRFSIKPS